MNMTALIWASVDIGSEQAVTYHYLYVNVEMSHIPLIVEAGKPYAVALVDIPEPYRTQFESSLRGRQAPIFEGRGPCAYLADFYEWVGAQRLAGTIWRTG